MNYFCFSYTARAETSQVWKSTSLYNLTRVDIATLFSTILADLPGCWSVKVPATIFTSFERDIDSSFWMNCMTAKMLALEGREALDELLYDSLWLLVTSSWFMYLLAWFQREWANQGGFLFTIPQLATTLLVLVASSPTYVLAK